MIEILRLKRECKNQPKYWDTKGSSKEDLYLKFLTIPSIGVSEAVQDQTSTLVKDEAEVTCFVRKTFPSILNS